LSTITNTYPDHEDIQGPSGYDVATTIAGFIPRGARVVTTEQQMRPLLRMHCEQRGTSLRSVGWLESGLITADILNRFPYREHPDNIALVAALADELGCDYDYAVKAMADRLIPDLGVLKTHPVADVSLCRIEFSNGMSANERFGALGNWSRLGFDRQDAFREPSVWISTVVNNRADRVARSRVFAHVLVNDIQADRHFLIGGNLKGLQGFLWEAWDDYVHTVSLCREGTAWDVQQAHQALLNLAIRFRVPHAPQHIVQALQPMLAAVLGPDTGVDFRQLAEELHDSPEGCAARLQQLGCDAAHIEQATGYQRQLLQALREFAELAARIDTVHGEDQVRELTTQLRAKLKDWFARKLVVIENYDATGDEIIQRIVDETPPGYLNRVMGMQNIKGTGLDFVYRFHAWDTCEQACRLVQQPDHARREAGLTLLEGLPEYGVLCRNLLTRTLAGIRDARPPLAAELQVQVSAIEQKLRENLATAATAATDTAGKTQCDERHPWLAWLVQRIEQWMETSDAVRRRQQADQVYRDLADERIGRQRAVEELRKINKRQKGGWLASTLGGYLPFFGSHG
jgi:hypothetical protein